MNSVSSVDKENASVPTKKPNPLEPVQNKKRPPSTPLTPSLINQNINKKHRIDEVGVELSKKNLRDSLVKESETLKGSDNIKIADDHQEDLEQEDDYLYKFNHNSKNNSILKRVSFLKSDFTDDIITINEEVKEDLDEERLKFDNEFNEKNNFKKFDEKIDFEIYKNNLLIESLINQKNFVKKQQLIDFLSLEKMFEKN